MPTNVHIAHNVENYHFSLNFMCELCVYISVYFKKKSVNFICENLTKTDFRFVNYQYLQPFTLSSSNYFNVAPPSK